MDGENKSDKGHGHRGRKFRGKRLKTALPLPRPAVEAPPPQAKSAERIAKAMARAGLCSRREAEGWIVAGRVAVNGAVIASPALNVGPRDIITVDGAPLPGRARTRLFLYHKTRGLVTTHSDPEGRDTLFRALPKHLPRLISVGRLDINTEGLLLLTNDGGLARVLELPATGWLRTYRVRALGRVTQDALDKLKDGVTITGLHYGPIEATLDREQGANVWLTFAIKEGKNREVRKVLEHLGLKVNRLIRLSYGPFELGKIDEGAVEEVETAVLRKTLGWEIAKAANADFEGPLEDEVAQARRSGARAKERTPRIQKREQPPIDADPGADEKKKFDARKKRGRRADRSGGPRPKYPRPRA
jgi:23S rRNA pseudouridine2605 synthase